MVCMEIEHSQNCPEGVCTKNGHDGVLGRACTQQWDVSMGPAPRDTSLLGAGDLVGGFITQSWRAHISHRVCASGEPAALERADSDLGAGELLGDLNIFQGLVMEGYLETCRCLLTFCKCLALWFNCCFTDIDPECIAH